MDDHHSAAEPKEGNETPRSIGARNHRTEGLSRIARDLDIYLVRISKAVEEYETGRETMTDHDPIAAYVRKMLAGAGTDLRLGNAPPRVGRAEVEHLEILSANRLIEDVVTDLREIVRETTKLKAEPADMELRIMANREKMGQVFASIVAYGAGIIRRGGTITILAKLLPMKSDLTGKGGCALLQVRSNDVAAGGPGPQPMRWAMSKKTARRAFSTIRSIIGEYHGSVSVMRRPGKARFNIYLPILHGA